LRAELKDRCALEGNGPNLAALLDLVALGTVADVVPLDDNNRRLVQQGLKRMRAGRCQPGIAALFRAAGRDMTRASAYDLGFALGPRLNAAGRLTDMTLGIECLTTEDESRADAIARELDALNRERRDIEAGMQDTALAAIEAASCGEDYTLSLFDPDWHQGVIGIVASRIKDRYHRPAIAFARGNDGEIKGSARSIPGLHMRDALDLVTKRHPGLVLKFGGHAAAAGLTLKETDFERFCEAFEATVRSLVTAAELERQIETDGSLALDEATLDAAAALAVQPWGSGFPEPRFHDCFEVASQRVVGGRHLRLKLVRETRPFDAILFGATDTLPGRIAAVYRLDVNEYQNTRTLQLTLHHWHSAV
jgi:single-stranded-DNA-specific exonuclease